MHEPPQHRRTAGDSHRLRRDPANRGDDESIWLALSQTPGVGVTIMDTLGSILFINPTSELLFFNHTGTDYRGKTVWDFHPPAFCEERIAMIKRVVAEQRPLRIRHIYYGRRIESTLWPIHDAEPPFHRVIVVTHHQTSGPLAVDAPSPFETIETGYIGLGPLGSLTQRELEVLVLLGHGLSVPDAAAALHRSPHTIQRHKEAISRKLDLHGQAELVSLVASVGLTISDTRLERYEGPPSQG